MYEYKVCIRFPSGIFVIWFVNNINYTDKPNCNAIIHLPTASTRILYQDTVYTGSYLELITNSNTRVPQVSPISLHDVISHPHCSSCRGGTPNVGLCDGKIKFVFVSVNLHQYRIAFLLLDFLFTIKMLS